MTDPRHVIPTDAVRGLLPGVPRSEADDPEMIALGPFVVEHGPPVAGRSAEAGCQLERDYIGNELRSPTWHRFFRTPGPFPRADGHDPDDDVDHWFEVGRWFVEDDA